MEIINFEDFKYFLKKFNKLLSYYNLKNINELQLFLTTNNKYYNKYIKECNFCDERFINEEYDKHFDKDIIDIIFERELDHICPSCLENMPEMLAEDEYNDVYEESDHDISENIINDKNESSNEDNKNTPLLNKIEKEHIKCDNSENTQDEESDHDISEDNHIKTSEIIDSSDEEIDGSNMQDNNRNYIEKELPKIQIQEDIENNKDVKINKESEKILNKIKNNHYEYHDKLMPLCLVDDDAGLNQSVCKINEFTQNKHIMNIKVIMEFSNIYKKYIEKHKDNQCKKTFDNFLSYDKYNLVYFDNLYLKIKKCYDFVNFLSDNGINEQNTIEIVFRSNLSYSKLFKIKNDDYTKLKNFYIDMYNNMLNKDDVEKIEKKGKREICLNRL